MGFRVEGFLVWGLGFRVEDLGFRFGVFSGSAWGFSGFRASTCSGLKAFCSGL